MRHPIVFLALVSVIGACVPQTEPDAELQRIADSVRVVVGAPGAIVAVQGPSGPLHVAASGLADLASERSMHPDDAFFLGSVSKTYTAAVVMRLVEQGLLSLDDPLSLFLPDFPRAQDVSLRQLLDHTSGLRDFYLYLYYRPDRQEMIDFVTRRWSEEELLELAGRFGSSFEPGADWAYSNTNYYLLGVVIERATGGTLAEAYRRLLYEPLGIEETWLSEHEPAPMPHETTGYMGPVEGWEHSSMFGEMGPTTELDRSPVEWGAGGLVAPAADASRFIRALMSGALLEPGSLSAMQAFHDTPRQGIGGSAVSERRDGYGLGLVRLELPGATLIGHGGLFTGHTSGVWYLPACGATIAIYLNRGFVGQRDALEVVLGGLEFVEASLSSCRVS